MGRRRTVAACAALGFGLAGVLVGAPAAHADPFSTAGCTFEHRLAPASDSSGAWWQLDLDARCAPDSGVRAIEWSVSLYSTGGSGSTRKSNRYVVGGPGTPERIVRDGVEHYVGRGAPRGEARYCYDVVARYYGLPTGFTTSSSAVPEKRSGRRCLDGVGA